MIYKKINSFIKHTNIVQYVTTITVCIVFSEFLKYFVNAFLMPILFSFFSNEEKNWEKLKLNFNNPFTNNIIEIPIGLLISKLIYLLTILIVTFSIYFHFIYEE